MGVTRWPGATWCDVTRDGRIVAVVGQEIHVRLAGSQLSGIMATTPEPIGWLRAETNAAGALALVGQGQSGAGRLWARGSWTLLGVTFGVSPLEIVADGAGWLCWMQTHADRYAMLKLDDTGKVVAEVSYAMPPTSQGWLDATDPELRFTDVARRIGGVTLPNACGTYLVGQDPAAERFLLADLAGTPLRVLAARMPIWEPRGAWVDGQLVAASRSDNNGAVIVRGRVNDFPVWTPAPVPEPTPEPEPEPEPEPTMWTGAHAEVLRRFVAKYPCPGGPGQDEAARDWTRKAAEQFAFEFAREGWGHKQADGGRPPSTDVIATRSPFVGYDLILSQGRADWSINYAPSPLPLDGQAFIAVTPTDWLGSVPVPPDPPPVPTQPPTSDLEARVHELEQWRRSVGVVTTTWGQR
jgi:hypothetical protein